MDPRFLRVANATVDLGAELAHPGRLGAVGVGTEFPHVRAVVVSQAVRRPPKGRFSEASLVAELERVGVGRPSTFSTIVQTVVDRGYAEVASGDGAPVPLVSLELACGSAAIVRTVEESVVGAFRKLVPTAAGRRDRVPARAPRGRRRPLHGRRGVRLDAIAAHNAPWRDAVRQIWAATSPRRGREGRGGSEGWRRPEGGLLSDRDDRTPSRTCSPTTGATARSCGSGSPAAGGPRVPKGTALADVTLDDALFLLSLPKFLKRSMAVALKHGRYGFYVERDPAAIGGAVHDAHRRGRSSPAPGRSRSPAPRRCSTRRPPSERGALSGARPRDEEVEARGEKAEAWAQEDVNNPPVRLPPSLFVSRVLFCQRRK